MKLVITDTIFGEFPELVLGIVILDNIENSQDSAEITEMLRQAEAALPGKFGSTPVIEQPYIAAWREAYRKFGAKPKDYPSSVENLNGKLFFHFARAGHKLDGILKNNKVSFCVIKTDEVIQETFTTHFRSVIVFGRARILTEDSEKKYALECLVEKYSPDYLAEGQSEIEREWDRVCAAEVQIEHMTGKAAIEIINNKA